MICILILRRYEYGLSSWVSAFDYFNIPLLSYYMIKIIDFIQHLVSQVGHYVTIIRVNCGKSLHLLIYGILTVALGNEVAQNLFYALETYTRPILPLFESGCVSVLLDRFKN
jgi:hypothetical protein